MESLCNAYFEYNRERIKQITKYAETRSEIQKEFEVISVKNLAENDLYLRISPDGVRLVSLRNTNPIGSVNSNSTKTIEKIPDFINKAINDANPIEVSTETLEKKTERRLQACIIKKALQRDGDLLWLGKGVQEAYDRLIFANDEISLKYGAKNFYRCDLLAVGIKDGQAFPVCIELKYARKCKELINQLSAFTGCIENGLSVEFNKMLSILTGIGPLKNNEIRKIAIWPCLKSVSQKKNIEFQKEKILELTFKANGEDFCFDDGCE